MRFRVRKRRDANKRGMFREILADRGLQLTECAAAGHPAGLESSQVVPSRLNFGDGTAHIIQSTVRQIRRVEQIVLDFMSRELEDGDICISPLRSVARPEITVDKAEDMVDGFAASGFDDCSHGFVVSGK